MTSSVAGSSPDSSHCLGALSHSSVGCWETLRVEYVQKEIKRGRSNLLKTAAHTHRLPSHVPSFNLSPNLWSRVICLGKKINHSGCPEALLEPKISLGFLNISQACFKLYIMSCGNSLCKYTPQQSAQLSIGKARRGALEQLYHKHPLRIGKNQTLL